MIAAGQRRVSLLMALPDGVQAGDVVKLLQDRNQTGDPGGIGWKIGLLDLEGEPRRRFEAERQGYVLGQGSGRIGLLVLAVKLAQDLGFFLCLVESLAGL